MMQTRKRFYRILICFLFSSCLFDVQIFPAGNKATIAVFELIDKGAGQETTLNISNLLFEVTSFEKNVDLVSQSDLEYILNSFPEDPKIYPNCRSVACLTDIAKVLGVETIISGQVRKFREEFAISLHIVSFNAAGAANSFSLKLNCEEDTLKQEVEAAGQRLLGDRKSVV